MKEKENIEDLAFFEFFVQGIINEKNLKKSEIFPNYVENLEK